MLFEDWVKWLDAIGAIYACDVSIPEIGPRIYVFSTEEYLHKVHCIRIESFEKNGADSVYVSDNGRCEWRNVDDVKREIIEEYL